MAFGAGRAFANPLLIDAVADCAHRDAFVYTKRKLFIASATPKPLGAPNCCECASLLRVAHVSSGKSRGIPYGGSLGTTLEPP